nr:aminotransferase class I/II-fold pyridoxal phosphate-dependent enzyme [Exiguobacterium sp. J17977]
MRIGWVVGPEPVINRLADIKMQTDYGSSSISQHLVEKWIRRVMYQTFIEQTRIRLKEQRDFVVELLSKHFTHIATWNIPSGGFWLDLKGDVSITKLFHLALKEGVLLNPSGVRQIGTKPFANLLCLRLERRVGERIALSRRARQYVHE